MELPENAIELDVAKSWISNWRQKESISTGDVIAYLIPSVDVKEISAENGWANFRTYNAINEEGEFKLLIVGVDENGNDLVDYNAGDYVYDMTTPCPSVCSLNEWWL